MYSQGKGVSRNCPLAAYWYRRAAAQNLVQAMNAMAWIYATSPEDGARSGRDAIRWAESALTRRTDAKHLTTIAAAYAEARDWLPALMVGPIPIIEYMQPYVFPNGIAYDFNNARIAELNAEYSALCEELGVPFLDIFQALYGNAKWEASQRGCDGVHVLGDGYAMIAALVADWPAWRAWLDD